MGIPIVTLEATIKRPGVVLAHKTDRSKNAPAPKACSDIGDRRPGSNLWRRARRGHGAVEVRFAAQAVSLGVTMKRYSDSICWNVGRPVANTGHTKYVPNERRTNITWRCLNAARTQSF